MLLSKILPLVFVLSGCAPMTRLQRALSPESFVSPQTPLGKSATVIVESGWHDELPVPYATGEPLVVRDGVAWVSPVPITDRGAIEVHPGRDDVKITLYARHTGLEQGDFHPLVARSGTLPRALPTTVRFQPGGPLTEPYRVEMRDLHSVYSDSPIRDGDLLLLEVSVPDAEPERYLFRSLDFGWHTRFGAGFLVRVPFPGDDDQGLSPALTASLALGYRFRTKKGGLTFVNEQLALVVAAGIGSHVLSATDQEIDDQLRGAFNEALIGGGLDLFRFAHLLVLGNAAGPFREEAESDWALALGVDAVQLARFSQDIGERLLRDRPLREDRSATPRRDR